MEGVGKPARRRISIWLLTVSRAVLAVGIDDVRGGGDRAPVTGHDHAVVALGLEGAAQLAGEGSLASLALQRRGPQPGHSPIFDCTADIPAPAYDQPNITPAARQVIRGDLLCQLGRRQRQSRSVDHAADQGTAVEAAMRHDGEGAGSHVVLFEAEIVPAMHEDRVVAGGTRCRVDQVWIVEGNVEAEHFVFPLG